MRILFLCSGNIHRSALAEAMMRDAAARDGRADIDVASAGTLGMPPLPAAEEAILLAREAGIDLTAHRSTPADEPALAAADLIVVMEAYHLQWVETECPEAAGRCRLLSDYAGPDAGLAAGEDVPDAMGEDLDAFRRTFGIIRDCVTRLYRDLPPPPEEVYTRAIEDRFRLRRGSPLSLSPADYDLVDRWWARGVPLWIVLETIDHLLGRKDGAGASGRVRRLSYCESEVERRFASFERARVGAAGSRPARAPRGEEILEAGAERLREAAGAALARSEPRVAEILESAARALSGGGDPRDAAAARLRLHAVSEELDEALRQASGETRIASLRAEAETSLAEHRGRMTPAAFEATVGRYVLKRLREIHEIPDITGPGSG